MKGLDEAVSSEMTSAEARRPDKAEERVQCSEPSLHVPT